MTPKHRKDITRISKDFASGFEDTLGDINQGGWLIVEPLSAYLNAEGYHNRWHQIAETDRNPIVLVMTFDDGSQFIPQGADLQHIHHDAKNWMWI